MIFAPEDLRAIGQSVADALDAREAIAAKLPADRIGYPEREAAAALGVQWYTLRNARLAGEIRARKLGRSWVYSRDALVRWLEGGR